MNNKGLTIIELIVSFALAAVMAFFLIEIVLYLKGDYYTNGVKANIINKQTLISSRINQILNNNTIIDGSYCGATCVELLLEDSTRIQISFNSDSNEVIIGDYVVVLPTEIAINNVSYTTETTIGVGSGKYNTVFQLYAELSSATLEDKVYPINVIYQYDNREQNWYLGGEGQTYYTLTVNANGGTWSGTSPQTILSDYTVTVNNPTKDFYVFSGWTVSCTGCSMAGTTFTMGSSNATLTASYVSMFSYTGTYTFIDDGSGNWRIKLLTNGTFTPAVNMAIDVFLVGGGASGTSTDSSFWKLGGGGGGYTATYSSKSLTANTAYSITIGAGGTPSSVNGVATSGFGYTVNGGNGMDGGSGGGNGGYTDNGAYGGTDGGNGGTTEANRVGYGQGTTTREFGEATGTLYAGGGGGGGGYCPGCTPEDKPGGPGGTGGGGNGIRYNGLPATNGQPNTGGGAGSCTRGVACMSGGSGIVVIRNHR